MLFILKARYLVTALIVHVSITMSQYRILQIVFLRRDLVSTFILYSLCALSANYPLGVVDDRIKSPIFPTILPITQRSACVVLNLPSDDCHDIVFIPL